MQREHTVTAWWINQYREAIGVFSPHGGPSNTLPGGKYQHYMVDTKLKLTAKKEDIGDVQGVATHETTEMMFKFEKSKAGFSIKSGEYDLIMDDAGRDDGLVTGQADDFKTLVIYAKKLGVLTGGGSRWKLNGIDQTFNALDPIVNYIKRDREADLRIRRLCIMLKRARTKVPMIPADRYLLAPLDLEGAEELETAAEALITQGAAADE
jgi:hypothetical protein